MDSLVSVEWLEKHLSDPDVVVLDCTNFAAFDDNKQIYKTVSGHKNWAAGHIPGSQHADFTAGLSSENLKYRNALPSVERFAAGMESLGVGNNRRVILYDSDQSMWAARVWWMLRWIGFDNSAILDGGLESWKLAGKSLSTTPQQIKTSNLSTNIRPELFTDKAAVINALHHKSTIIIDALSADQFYNRKSDLGLCGHIPGATNIPATSLLDPISLCYLPEKELQNHFPVDRFQKTIVYCGSGIAAASVAFVMDRLGFSDIAIYMPGLQEWIQDPNLPMSDTG